MKKRIIAVLLALSSVFSFNTVSFFNNNEVSAVSVTEEKSDVLEKDSFFVVVGLYSGKFTQLRYMYPSADRGYDSKKVVLTDAAENLSYGDILIANRDIELTQVRNSSNSVYAMASYYVLNDDAELKHVGNCSDFMEQKELTISSKTYDGSGHWSINLTDESGEKYYYGLNIFASSLGVDVVNDSKAGDKYIFAFYNGKITVPLSKVEEDVLSGDLNSDGIFNVSDMVIFQQWLLGASNVKRPDLKAADLSQDGILNILDLCMMKHELLQYMMPSYDSEDKILNAVVRYIEGNTVIISSSESPNSDLISIYPENVEEFKTGDLLEIIYDGCIVETYPEQIYAKSIRIVEHISEESEYSYQLVRADCIRGDNPLIPCDNEVEMEKYKNHTPVKACATFSEFNELKQFISENYSTDTPYDSPICFDDAVLKYDEAFFENNTLMVVAIEESSGSVSHMLQSVEMSSDSKLTASIIRTFPVAQTCDMANWFYLIECPKEKIQECSFDAILK